MLLLRSWSSDLYKRLRRSQIFIALERQILWNKKDKMNPC